MRSRWCPLGRHDVVCSAHLPSLHPQAALGYQGCYFHFTDEVTKAQPYLVTCTVPQLAGGGLV